MRRRYPFPNYRWGTGPSQSAGRLILFSVTLALALSVLVVLKAKAQDTTPPAPPPDVQASPETLPGQTLVRAVRLSDVEGQVEIFRNGEIAFNQAEPNMPAVEGMRFVTGDNGRVEIQFEDGSVARVAPNSSIRLTQLRRDTDGTMVTQIDALKGLSYYELRAKTQQISVHFDGDSVTPTQSTIFRIALDPTPNQLSVMHGIVHVDDGGGVSLDVHPNQTFQTNPQQSGEFTVAENIDPNSWDQWNADRDRALSELQASETLARAGSGNPDNPAWNDLDYYGDWYDVPGYGQVWAPSGVSANWDPFGNGYWGYYPSFGYTWISGYPWGWWPYHCGAWDYLNAWGWMWVPGNCGYGLYGAGWYPYSTVWNVPLGYSTPVRPPVRPPHGVGPHPRPTPLVPVDRGPQYSAPFRIAQGSRLEPRPAPRPLSFEGKNIQPVAAGFHPAERGPLGESFTATVVREHPEFGPVMARNPGALGFRTPAEHPASRGALGPVDGIRSFGAPPGFSSHSGASLSRGFSSAAGGDSHASFGGGGAPHAPAGAMSGGGGHVGGGAPAGGGSHH